MSRLNLLHIASNILSNCRTWMPQDSHHDLLSNTSSFEWAMGLLANRILLTQFMSVLRFCWYLLWSWRVRPFSCVANCEEKKIQNHTTIFLSSLLPNQTQSPNSNTCVINSNHIVIEILKLEIYWYPNIGFQIQFLLQHRLSTCTRILDDGCTLVCLYVLYSRISPLI